MFFLVEEILSGLSNQKENAIRRQIYCSRGDSVDNFGDAVGGGVVDDNDRVSNIGFRAESER
jgi:hypothetical protein